MEKGDPGEEAGPRGDLEDTLWSRDFFLECPVFTLQMLPHCDVLETH